GRGGTAYYKVTDNTQDECSNVWTAEIGRPIEAMTAVGYGYRRYHDHGVALVNPNAINSQTFVLDRNYIGGTGATTNTVTLAPTTGAVLFVVDKPTPTPPPGGGPSVPTPGIFTERPDLFFGSPKRRGGTY